MWEASVERRETSGESERGGGLEMLPSRLLPPSLLLLLISLLTPAISGDVSSHGCFWTESCQSKWVGGCGAELVVVDQSDNCNDLCGEPNYPPCLPFHTHFHCCKPESPRVMNRCARCKNKLDFGDEYVCCSDCSDPVIIDKSSKLGFCRTGAELAAQLKPQAAAKWTIVLVGDKTYSSMNLEVFKWVAGPWMKCSSPCDGGVRYRDVGCYGSIDDSSIKHYPVDDSRCSDQEMPVRQDPCNLQSCGDLNFSDSTKEPIRISGWLVALFVLLGLVATGAVGCVGYAYYKRRTSTQSGFVYIMLEGYS